MGGFIPLLLFDGVVIVRFGILLVACVLFQLVIELGFGKVLEFWLNC